MIALFAGGGIVVLFLIGMLFYDNWMLRRRMVKVERQLPTARLPALTATVVDETEISATHPFGEPAPPRQSLECLDRPMVLTVSTVDMAEVDPARVIPDVIQPRYPSRPPAPKRIRADVLTARIRAEQGRAR